MQMTDLALENLRENIHPCKLNTARSFDHRHDYEDRRPTFPFDLNRLN